MNIYLFELKKYKKSILIWSLSVFAFVYMYMSFYPSFATDNVVVDAMLENYPKEFLAAFGMNVGLPMSSVLGYFALTFSFVQLLLAIQSSNYGFHILSVEERELTADFLLSKPVTRTKIIVSKFLAALTSLIIVNIATWVASISAVLTLNGGNDYEMNNLIVLLSTVVIFQLFFLSVGMLISVLVKKISSVLSYSMALSFGMYILTALSGILDSKLLAFITPFSHFNPNDILLNGSHEIGPVLLSVGIILLSLTASYFLYLKRNIHSL